jgi:hypothetical protein
MDLNTSFLLNVRRKTSRRLDDSGKKAYVGGFEFHVGADVTWTLEQFRKAICDRYSWNVDDEVQFSYFDKFENKSMKIKSDLDLSLMFAMYLGERYIVSKIMWLLEEGLINQYTLNHLVAKAIQC